jgi:ATP-dependent helicase/nuclease subunit A
MVGRIDRLAVDADQILIADFKTGAPPVDGRAPANYVQQLALYCDALARIYPGRTMQALLVWTAGPAIHRIEPEGLRKALAAAIGTPKAL